MVERSWSCRRATPPSAASKTVRSTVSIPQLQTSGQTAVVVAVDGVLGVIGIADVVRPQAAEAIADLHRIGVDRIVMLTGDNRCTADAIARRSASTRCAPTLTRGQVDDLRELAAQYGHVGMVGDGVNDAPALAAASVGIAMGTAGSDVALETADVALMADDLAKLTEALRIGRRTGRSCARTSR